MDGKKWVKMCVMRAQTADAYGRFVEQVLGLEPGSSRPVSPATPATTPTLERAFSRASLVSPQVKLPNVGDLSASPVSMLAAHPVSGVIEVPSKMDTATLSFCLSADSPRNVSPAVTRERRDRDYMHMRTTAVESSAPLKRVHNSALRFMKESKEKTEQESALPEADALPQSKPTRAQRQSVSRLPPLPLSLAAMTVSAVDEDDTTCAGGASSTYEDDDDDDEEEEEAVASEPDDADETTVRARRRRPSVASSDTDGKRKRRVTFTRAQRRVMQQWRAANAGTWAALYPSKAQCAKLAAEAHLRPKQVEKHFDNFRQRHLAGIQRPKGRPCAGAPIPTLIDGWISLRWADGRVDKLTRVDESDDEGDESE